MSLDQKKQLEQQLWNIANTLRGKMDADEFRDYILGFIFYKYLSEKMQLVANKILKDSGETIQYQDIDETTEEGKEYLQAIKDETVEGLGYFLKPSELFSSLATRLKKKMTKKKTTRKKKQTPIVLFWATLPMC
jgi:type I restriction enzyme M protein